MPKSTLAVSVLSLLLFVACIALFSRIRRDAQAMTVEHQLVTSTRADYVRTLDEISAIQDTLNAIAAGSEATLRITSSADTMSGRQEDLALARLAALREGIRKTRDRIASLESRLAQGNVQIAGLGRMVTQLKRDLAGREEMLAVLGGRIDSLQTHVADLNSSVESAHQLIAAQTDTLEQRRRELGTVYVAAGTKDALLKDGVVVARGGVLGLGKTLGPANTASPSAFHAVDTDQETVIPLTGKRAQVLTPQPADSYSIVSVGDHLELRILAPLEFRKVKRLVIVTA